MGGKCVPWAGGHVLEDQEREFGGGFLGANMVHWGVEIWV